jgi:hypothetical protein
MNKKFVGEVNFSFLKWCLLKSRRHFYFIDEYKQITVDEGNDFVYFKY